jgi:hypothetical protein
LAVESRDGSVLMAKYYVVPVTAWVTGSLGMVALQYRHVTECATSNDLPAAGAPMSDSASKVAQAARPDVKVLCPTCKTRTQHGVVADIKREMSDDDVPFFAIEHSQIVECRGCETLSFRKTYEDSNMGPDDDVAEILWPPRDKKRSLMPGWFQLPKPVSGIYRETNMAMGNAQPVLAAVGIRAIVEAVCKHKKAKGKNLKQRIDGLVVRGALTRTQARVLHKTRFLGNKAAHEAKPAEPRVLEAAMLIGEHMLTSVYLLAKIAKPMGKK